MFQISSFEYLTESDFWLCLKIADVQIPTEKEVLARFWKVMRVHVATSII